jgi:dolichol-phosphate mannosyltransferase
MNLGPELSIVIPTFNEKDNVRLIIQKLRYVLSKIRWEVIFVDDNSADQTAQLIKQIGQKDFRVRIIHRIGRRGLSSAAIEGMLASTAPYILLMDADHQHDETLIPHMLTKLKRKHLDLVIASRFTEDADQASMSYLRTQISRFANKISRSCIDYEVKDMMSGFFILKSSVIQNTAPYLSKIGFKILADILASSKNKLKIEEMPYTFRARHKGESKLDARVTYEFILLILDKLLGRLIPLRLISFLIVGSIGLVVHILTFLYLHFYLSLDFKIAQIISVLFAITSNYTLNNALTYFDLRHKGDQWFKGLLSFMLISGLGAMANVGLSFIMFDHSINWQLSLISGILVGVMWNYILTQKYTWEI